MLFQRFPQLLALACGTDSSELSAAGQVKLATTGALCALAFSAVWGIAAGSASPQLAAAAAVKVPIVILLAAVAALPAGLLALKLTGAALRARQMLLSFSTAMFGGSLVLAALAPIVAIYYHTSAVVGVPLALGSAITAIAIAALIFARSVYQRLSATGTRKASLFAVAVLVGLYCAALVQFIALASPIIGETTAFDTGVDGWLR